MPTGIGFADFVYIPKPEHKLDYPALVVELKWNQSAETALKQVEKKKYTATFQEYRGRVLLIGINYDKKIKKHTCILEKMIK